MTLSNSLVILFYKFFIIKIKPHEDTENVCARCRLPFTRKWNAIRHCNNKHSGVIENIISFTEYVINQKDLLGIQTAILIIIT